MISVKLQIQDEVNCRFIGLPADVRRKLYKDSKIFNPALRFTPAVRLGRWDGKVAYFTISGETYINLLGPIIEYLVSEGYSIELEDLRTYNRNFDFDAIDKDYVSNYVWPEGHPAAGKPIILRDHQVEATNIFLKEIQGISCLPTASGKSLVTAILSKKVEKYGRSIIIVPNKDLITQTEVYYKILGLDVGVYYGDRKDFFKTHTICTWQSLEKLRQSPIDIGVGDPITFERFTQNVVGVIVDECLALGTKILTPTGEKSIETLKKGDAVYSYDESTKLFIIDEIVKLHQNLSKSENVKMLEIELENNSIIQITANHKVLTQRGWIEAGNLLITDEIKHFAIQNSDLSDDIKLKIKAIQ